MRDSPRMIKTQSPTNKKTLDDIAIENLTVLSQLPNNGQIIVEDNLIQRLSSSSDDYESIFSLKELSYPVSFSFYRMFRMIEAERDYAQRVVYLDLLNGSLDTLHYRICHTEEADEVWMSLKMIVNDLEDRYSMLYEIYKRKSLCERVQGSIEDFFDAQLDALVKIFKESRTYLYLTPMTRDLDSDEDSDEESPEPPDSDSDEESPKSLDSDSDEESPKPLDSDSDSDLDAVSIAWAFTQRAFTQTIKVD